MFINSINYLIILWFILYGTASGPGELSTALGGGWITLKTKCQVGVRPQPTPRLQRWLGQTRKNRVRELTCYKPHRNAHLFTMYSGLPASLSCVCSRILVFCLSSKCWKALKCTVRDCRIDRVSEFQVWEDGQLLSLLLTCSTRWGQCVAWPLWDQSNVKPSRVDRWCHIEHTSCYICHTFLM